MCAGVAECVGEPIKNRLAAQSIVLASIFRTEFEYEIGEMGSGSATTHGKMKLNLKDSYGQLRASD